MSGRCCSPMPLQAVRQGNLVGSEGVLVQVLPGVGDPGASWPWRDGHGSLGRHQATWKKAGAKGCMLRPGWTRLRLSVWVAQMASKCAWSVWEHTQARTGASSSLTSPPQMRRSRGSAGSGTQERPGGRLWPSSCTPPDPRSPAHSPQHRLDFLRGAGLGGKFGGGSTHRRLAGQSHSVVNWHTKQAINK